MAAKPREVTVTLGKFTVTGKKIEADFEFDVTDKNVRYLTGMRHYAVGIQEPDLGQKKKYEHEYTAWTKTLTPTRTTTPSSPDPSGGAPVVRLQRPAYQPHRRKRRHDRHQKMLR
jgi:hypothetical protein